MTDLRDLYQEVILDHNKKPRNFRKPEGANRRAEGYNPLCGDRITLHLTFEDGLIRDIGFEGSGCAISKASASMMTVTLKGKTAAEAEAIFQKFHRMVTGTNNANAEAGLLGSLAAFSGVREFPVRVKCASLAWHTLRAALAAEPQPVSTE